MYRACMVSAAAAELAARCAVISSAMTGTYSMRTFEGFRDDFVRLHCARAVRVR